MSVDLAKDIAYVPKVSLTWRQDSSGNLGYIALTSDHLYFVPEADEENSQNATELLELEGEAFEKLTSHDPEALSFWRVIPELAQILPPQDLAGIIHQMAAACEGGVTLPLSEVKEFRFGLIGLEAVTEDGKECTFNLGGANKKTKKLKGFMKSNGLPHRQ